MPGRKKKSAVQRRAEKVRPLTEGAGESAEDYRHGDRRKNIPGSGQADYDTAPVERKKYAYDPHLDPQLVWAGKAERTSFEVDTVSLHIHERISTQAILRAAQSRAVQRTLFNDPAEELKPAQRVEFYKHDMGWTNRLILGDSLVVMNSLLEREGMAGKVQVTYIDPPYGIRFNSNFQPSIADPKPKEASDSGLTREPETIQAYRDTWQLEIHSYLTYLRDRLLLVRDLLHETGSCFVQISEENLHRVRLVMDEVFGPGNFCAIIAYKTTTGRTSRTIPSVCDFILWYAKDASQVKYHQLYIERNFAEDLRGEFKFIELDKGKWRPLTDAEKAAPEKLDRNKVFRTNSAVAPGVRPNTTGAFEHDGVRYDSGPTSNWMTTMEGMKRVASLGRLIRENSPSRMFKQFWTDFPYIPVTNVWTDTRSEQNKSYVVQTDDRVIERCILMCTDPGDLILDPTCGSGTTAWVSEKYGRRWVTIDTSKVALSLARERLLLAQFPYYRLQNLELGIRGGLTYDVAEHVNIRSLGRAEEAKRVTLYDSPQRETNRVRVSGPFSVEAIPKFSLANAEPTDGRAENLTANIANILELLRKDGVTFKGGKKMAFTRLTPTSGGVIHAEGEAQQDGKAIQVAVSIGPMHGPVTVDQMLEAQNEVSADVKLLIFVGFSFDPECFAFRDKRQPKSTRWE
ncbi:MAG TPA: DNA methyltransferase, partial [Candidatus Thermoplasmatota archaeon]|nr:DNA methyltransferase [Candidatus Thermoplasmatota archaeon]